MRSRTCASSRSCSSFRAEETSRRPIRRRRANRSKPTRTIRASSKSKRGRTATPKRKCPTAARRATRFNVKRRSRIPFLRTARSAAVARRARRHRPRTSASASGATRPSDAQSARFTSRRSATVRASRSLRSVQTIRQSNCRHAPCRVRDLRAGGASASIPDAGRQCRIEERAIVIDHGRRRSDERR